MNWVDPRVRSLELVLVLKELAEPSALPLR